MQYSITDSNDTSLPANLQVYILNGPENITKEDLGSSKNIQMGGQSMHYQDCSSLAESHLNKTARRVMITCVTELLESICNKYLLLS